MKLSICIPVYNVAQYMERCARSLFEQSYLDIEYIFVDDATPDDSIAILERVIKDYPSRRGSVRILHHDRNLGLVAARKSAIRAATGEIIAHCDSDDWVDVNFYNVLVDCLVATESDIVMCSIIQHRDSDVFLRECPDGISISGKEAMVHKSELPGLNSLVNKIYRRELVDISKIEWPDDICICEDYCHVMQILPRCRRLTTVRGAYYHYRINSGSMTRSRNIDRLLANHIRVYEILTHNVQGLESRPVRHDLVRQILFWGVVTGRLSYSDFIRWRDIFFSLDGKWEWCDMSLWGQRMMKIAACSYQLSRIVSPFVRGWIDDCI